MALSGPESKSIKHGRTPNADWTDVPDVPFAGPWPIDLPAKCRLKKWHPQVTDWWNDLKVMPHCLLWRPPDWRFAVRLAYMYQQFWEDLADGEMHSTTATEIRRCEDLLGVTAEARRKLRIRYVSPDTMERREAAAGDVGGLGTVTSIEDRRARLTG